MRKMNYEDYPHTILVLKDNPRKPTQKWVDRKEGCQKIRSYRENREKQQNVAMVLEDLFVIDIDVGKDKKGIESFKKLIESFDDEMQEQVRKDIANTYSLKTPSGGWHLYFLRPENVTGKRKVDFLPSVDLLTGRNAFVPANGCCRAKKDGKAGGEYKKTPESKEYIIEAPQWVVDLFTSEKMKMNEDKNERMTESPKFEQSEGNLPLDRVFNAIQHGFLEGSRNSEFTSLIGTLLNYYKYDRISQSTIAWILQEVAGKCEPPFPEKEVAEIWNSLVKKEIAKVQGNRR